MVLYNPFFSRRTKELIILTLYHLSLVVCTVTYISIILKEKNLEGNIGMNSRLRLSSFTSVTQYSHIPLFQTLRNKIIPCQLEFEERIDI